MHTVQLILKPTEYEKSVIDKRFHAVSHTHNVCVKHAKKLLMQLVMIMYTSHGAVNTANF